MSQTQTRSSERVVVWEADAQLRSSLNRALHESLPMAQLQSAESLEHLMQLVQQDSTDIVVVDQDLAIAQMRELIYQLRNSDSQPSLVVVSPSRDPALITELYRHGCQRFIIKDERWVQELALSARHLLRYRQLVEENIKIRSRLTEANMLLDERNRRLDEFSATLAHDIRGPLGSISMKLEYLLEHHQEPLDSRAQEIMGRALKSCGRLTETVQAMYDLAKLGSKATERKMLKLEELVTDVIADLSLNQALDIEIAIGELPQIWGNAGLLRRVFSNLISNAVKYNDKQSIRIKVDKAAYVRRGMGQFVEIFIEDNGPGIPLEEHREIFSLFRRGSSSKSRADGTGVGLAVVQRIVELHFGEVRVASAEPQGTRFTIILPVEPLGLIPEGE